MGNSLDGPSGATQDARRIDAFETTTRPTLLAAAVLLAPLAAFADPVTGISFDHDDWTIACDDTRTCRAAGYQADEGEHLPVSVLLTRKAGARQTVTAELTLGQYDEIKMPAS
nr:DUF1176 domain-containing protein [Xanthomonas oryzae]